MSTASGEGETATHECPVCRSTVPAAPFCGNCGASFDNPVLLRPRTFAVAPQEGVVWPVSVTSTMFPHLSKQDRMPFRHGLFLVMTLVALFSLSQLLGPLVIVVSLGIPLLFALYVWRSDAFANISAPALAISTVLGAGLSTLWWWRAGKALAAEYDIPLGAASQLQWLLGLGLSTTLAGTGLMLLPALAVRMLRLPARESLDGFLIGALGALAYSAAGVITWLAPQYVEGLLNNYSSWLLLEEAALYGLFDPLTSAAAGGVVGLALWFRPARGRNGQPKHVRGALWILAAVCSSLFVSIYLVDSAQLPRAWEIAINTVITAASMVAARVALQAALLYEAPDPPSHLPVRCNHCDQTVPEMPFCSQCGAAARGMSRSARQARRQTAPAEGVE